MKLSWIKIPAQTIVKFCRVEGTIARLAESVPLLKNLIPPHTTYLVPTIRNVIRDNTSFQLDISDYMQWYVLVYKPDLSWQLALKYASPNSIVVDIGANIGQFSLRLATNYPQLQKADIKILSIEPNPLVYQYLNANLKLNPTISNVIQTVQMAIGETNGEIPFIYSMSNSGAGKRTQPGRETVTVQMSTLAQLIEQLNFTQKVSFIKIDVEGFEPEVLNGAWRVIADYLPTLFIEYSPSLYRERGFDGFLMISQIQSLNYHLFYEMEDGLVEWKGSRAELDSINQTNILAIPADLPAMVQDI